MRYNGRMRYLIFLSLISFACLAPFSVYAAGEVSQVPICGVLYNSSLHKVYGALSTDIAGEREGMKIRHTESFKLEAGNRMEFCSRGPFYEGQRLELSLRTLFPVFSCKTKIDREIIISSTPRPEGGLKYLVDCN